MVFYFLDVFYSVVNYSDSSFTHKQKEEFFRDCILKHSRSRVNPKKKILKGKVTLFLYKYVVKKKLLTYFFAENNKENVTEVEEAEVIFEDNN